MFRLSVKFCDGMTFVDVLAKKKKSILQTDYFLEHYGALYVFLFYPTFRESKKPLIGRAKGKIIDKVNHPLGAS